MKKILIFALVFSFVICLPVSAYAGEKATLPAFDVTFNGQHIQSGYRQFPLIVYRDITYVPMTYHDCRYLGLTTLWDNDTRTLYIEKRNITCAYRDYNWEWKNPDTCDVTLCDFNIVVNGKTIDNAKEEYPLLLYRDVTYFPLTWRFAVEEFGWKYAFDAENGLNIVSDNNHTENIYLPNISGDVATDGIYYYYIGTNDDKTAVYRAPVLDTTKAELIHEVPGSPMGAGPYFSYSDEDIYVHYYLGSSAVSSTAHNFKIEKDGTLTSMKPSNYSGGKHGYSEITKEADGIFVKAVNDYVDSATRISYTVNGEEKVAEPLPGRVRICCRRNGIKDENKKFISIFDNKIYYTGTDLDSQEDSALYCIDVATGKHTKLIDGVWGFHVYKGWLNKESADSTMILYDNDGRLMRYSELNGKTKEIENGRFNKDLPLLTAIGGIDIYTVQQAVGGNRTVVKAFSCYADGTGSINNVVLLDTVTGVQTSRWGERLCVSVLGEAPGDDVRLWISTGNSGYGFGSEFISSDTVDSMWIYKDVLLYKLGKDTVVKAVLK